MIDRTAAINTVRRLLRPIVRLMIGVGINARDFMEIVKMVYADVALQEGGRQGQANTLSEAARMTGLTRREVTRLRGVLEKVRLDSEGCQAPAERVLEAWYTDPKQVVSDLQSHSLARRRQLTGQINRVRDMSSTSEAIGELEANRSI